MARIISGVVSSDKANKTIVVSVTTRKTHPIYKKQYSVTTKFMAHDEENVAHLGDSVEITEHRPISAKKRWSLVKVTEKAPTKHVEEAPKEEATK